MIHTREIDNYEDLIDVRDVIEAYETARDDEDTERAQELRELLDELRGNGGDEQWEGHWYPLTMIRDSYFTEYAEQLAEDIGAINESAEWPNNCIDWERAARELQMDYTPIEFNGVTYWVR
jgi:hypothetical protein